jgi:hypothetical protein
MDFLAYLPMGKRRNIMYLVLGSERANFDQYIVEAELNVNAFEVSKEEDAPGSKGFGSLGDAGTGTIKVTYKPSGVSSRYRDGVIPPPWLQFDLDLKRNLFKTQ